MSNDTVEENIHMRPTHLSILVLLLAPLALAAAKPPPFRFDGPAGPQFTDEQKQTQRDSGARVVPLVLGAFRSGEWSCLLETRLRSRGDGAS